MDGGPRTEGTAPALRFPDATGHWYRIAVEPASPVWVRLDAILMRDPGEPRRTNGAGVELTGETRGELTHWIPTVDGFWLGLVSYALRYADGRPSLRAADQLVPAYALRPRTVRESDTTTYRPASPHSSPTPPSAP